MSAFTDIAIRAETLFRVKGLNKLYDDVIVLRDVNFEIKNVVVPGRTQGQVVGLLGPSGRGKSQLFGIASGLIEPTSGTVELWNGKEFIPTHPGLVGVVDQKYTLFRDRRIGDALVYAAKKGGHPKAEREGRARAMLKRFGLEDRWKAFPKELSGGQRQRIAIAQQLLCSAHFLFMDEPFSGLDPNMKAEAMNLIMEVAAADELMTIVVVTHDIGSAIKISDEIKLLGFERDAAGNAIPGSRIIEEIDLIGPGLAWDPNMTRLPAYHDMYNRVLDRFRTL